MKKALNIIKKVIVTIIFVFTIVMTVFTVVSVMAFNRTDRDILGYKAFIVLSDSMSATDFSAGDLVISKRVDPTTLQEGDIISFISTNEESYGSTVTHKIRSKVVNANGDPGFITYGTTTNTNDSMIVTYPYIVGKYVFSIAKVGLFFQFLKTTQGYIFCILIPFLILILYNAIETLSLIRQYRREQEAEIEKEKQEIKEQQEKELAALAKQREENERQMAELMRMQRELNESLARQKENENKPEKVEDIKPEKEEEQ